MRRREFITLVGSATAAWPFSARAQQAALPVIGVLDHFGPQPKSIFMQALHAGLVASGFIEGTKITLPG